MGNREEAQASPPCVDCRFFDRRNQICGRRTKISPVLGETTVYVSAFDERTPGWFDRLLDADRCGVAGLYFQPSDWAEKRMKLATKTASEVVARLRSSYSDGGFDE